LDGTLFLQRLDRWMGIKNLVKQGGAATRESDEENRGTPGRVDVRQVRHPFRCVELSQCTQAQTQRVGGDWLAIELLLQGVAPCHGVKGSLPVFQSIQRLAEVLPATGGMHVIFGTRKKARQAFGYARKILPGGLCARPDIVPVAFRSEERRVG